jgi:hypothetical protein
MGVHLDLVRDSAGFLNSLVEEELELSLRNSRNIAEETTPGMDDIFYMVGPKAIYSEYTSCIWDYRDVFDDSSFPRKDGKGRKRFYTVLIMVLMIEMDGPGGRVWKTLSSDAEGEEEEALVETALDLRDSLRSKNLRLSKHYDDYPLGRKIGRQIWVYYFPVNIVRDYRQGIAEVIFDQGVDPDEFEDGFKEPIAEFVAMMNQHLRGSRLDGVEDAGILRKDFEFTLNHEITHWYIDQKAGDHGLGSVEEGFAQFTDRFLDLKKKIRMKDGYYIASNEDIYESYEDKGYSKDFINWTVQILQEKYMDYNGGSRINGALDDFRKDAVEFFDTDPESPKDLFRFMMPETIKQEVRDVKNVIEDDIDRPLMKFLKQYRNNNQAPPGFLKRADLDDEEEVKSAVYTAETFREIVLKRMVVNAVENKKEYGFYEEELDELIEQEIRKITGIVKKIKTLWRVLNENGHEWPELKKIVEQLREAEEELEELDARLT